MTRYPFWIHPAAGAVVPWLLAGVMLVTGCGGKKPSGGAAAAAGANGTAVWRTRAWPMTRGGKALQGRVRDPVPRHPVVDWTYAANSAVTSEAVMADGLIVFGTDDGSVIAVEMATRKQRWRVDTRDTVEAAPAIASGRVFVGSNDTVFRALDLSTGKELWHIDASDRLLTGAVVTASPDGREEWVLVNSCDGVSSCLRARDGKTIWQHETGNYINGSSVVSDGGWVAFGGCDAAVHQLRLTDGGPLREIPTDGQVSRSLASWDGALYGVNLANQLIAVEAGGDKPAWVYEDHDAEFLSSPAVDEERVYVGCRDKHVHAVDRRSGQRGWKFRTGGRVECAPLVFDDAVVFGSADGRLYAVDKQSGREIWRLDLGENLAQAPAFAAGRLVIGGMEGSLFVIRDGDNP